MSHAPGATWREDGVDPFVWNPFDEATRRDPFPLYARARREHPVYAHEGLPVFSIFRHADVLAVLKDVTTWSSVFPPPPGMTAEDMLPSMLSSDPPQHTRLRSLVSQAFTPRMVRRLEPRMVEIAEGLLDAALERRRVDLVEVLTYPLPVTVIAEMIGVPIEDREQFKRWSDEAVANLGVVFFNQIPEERLAAMRRTVTEMGAYFTRLAAARRVRPEDDLLSGLVAAEVEGSRLGEGELLAMLILLLVAGNETTTTLIGNAVLELLAHAEALARLRADPGLLPTAIDEVLRFASPIQMDPRRATRPIELHGRRIEADQFVLCWLGSANRDEAVFSAPDEFDVARTDNRHLAFGFGPHYCLGANLASLEAEVALRVLLARTRSIARTDDAPLPLHPSIVFRGVVTLPVELRPA
jgi:cytochrome P450